MSMEVFTVLATLLAVFTVGYASDDHVRKVIHVPYKIHTIHHHKVQKVPVPVPIVKQVPIYQTVEVPVLHKVHVPILQKIHVPVHVPIPVYHKPHHHEAHEEYTSHESNNYGGYESEQQWQDKTGSTEGSHYSGAYPQSRSSRVKVHVPLKWHVVHKHHVKKVPVPVPYVKNVPVHIVRQVPVYKTVKVPVVKQVVVPVPVYVSQPHVEEPHVAEPQVHEPQVEEIHQQTEYTPSQPIIQDYSILNPHKWENTLQLHQLQNSYADQSGWSGKNSEWDNYLNFIDWKTGGNELQHLYDYNQQTHNPVQYYVKIHDEPQETFQPVKSHYITKHQLSDQHFSGSPLSDPWQVYYPTELRRMSAEHSGSINHPGIGEIPRDESHGENNYTDRQVYDHTAEFMPVHNYHAKEHPRTDQQSEHSGIVNQVNADRRSSDIFMPKNTKLAPVNEKPGLHTKIPEAYGGNQMSKLDIIP
uniref:Putative repetitive proline-rich cell wall protein n=1 Tax=Lutzomyia longipalpis TaxID=7200 RepID=A0A1B0CPW7_LUTLO